MRIVSPLLKAVVYPTLSNVGAFRRTANQGLAVVTYHGVTPQVYRSEDRWLDANLVHPETLRRHVRLIKKNYDLVSPEDVLGFMEGRQKLPAKAVLLTCDDGLQNCLTDMVPVLREESARCLFFVTAASAAEERTWLWYEELFLIFLRAPSGSIRASRETCVIEEILAGRKQRRAAWWRTVCRLSQVAPETRNSLMAELRGKVNTIGKPLIDLSNHTACRRYGLLTSDEIQKLVAAGMSVGSHTITHPILSRQEPENAYIEVARSRELLERATGKSIWAFAYPFGDAQSVNPQVVAMVRKAGYTAAFLNFDGGLGHRLEDHYSLPRIHVTNTTTLAELEAHISGFYGQIKAAFGQGSGLEKLSLI